MTWITSSEQAEELVEALEDAQTGLRDLEDALDGMKNPPEDLMEAVDRIRRARFLSPVASGSPCPHGRRAASG